MKRFILAALIIAAIVACDQATKLWAVDRLTDQPSIDVIGDVLRFTLVYNEGGAMGTQLGTSGVYLVLSIAVLGLIVWFMFSHRMHLPSVIAFASVAGGAIGNIIDRVRIGKVVDFIDVDIPDIHMLGLDLDRFWTFNVADSAISCAIVFLMFVYFFRKETASQEIQPESSQTEQSSSNP